MDQVKLHRLILDALGKCCGRPLCGLRVRTDSQEPADPKIVDLKTLGIQQVGDKKVTVLSGGTGKPNIVVIECASAPLSVTTMAQYSRFSATTDKLRDYILSVYEGEVKIYVDGSQVTFGPRTIVGEKDEQR